MPTVINFVINSEEKDQTIISFLKKRFKNTPLSLIYKLFRAKKIKLNEQDIRYYHHRLKEKDKIDIFDQSLKIATLPIFQKPPVSTIKFEIIYEDDNLLIVLKNHGIPMRSLEDNLDKAVNYYLYKQDPQDYQQKISSYFFYTAVHRLDKLTKGLVIYPKNNEAKKVLYNGIKDKQNITKTYLAVCENFHNVSLPSLVEGFIYKNEAKEKMVFSQKKPFENHGEIKQCAMEIEILYKKKNFNLLKIILHTGRKHQIRAILSFFKTPIVGDKKYGSHFLLNDKIYLFAYQLTFQKNAQPLNYLEGKSFVLEGLEGELTNIIRKENF